MTTRDERATVAGDAHWDDRYESIGADAVSWYQNHPATSLDLLLAVGAGRDDAVIDVGGGASNLVDHLVQYGYRDVSVLDLSTVALEVARSRVGDNAAVRWLVQDLLTWEPERTWDVWHDRAVLHFLLTEEDRSRYVHTLRRALRPGGAFVIGTFAEDGPTECSALPVRRQAPGDLRELIGGAEVIDERREVHETPSGARQPFNWIAGRLVSTEPRIDAVLASARQGLPPRPTATDLPALLARGALVVDIRPVEQRERDGDLPGAIVIDRNVLEWRLDPTSPHRIEGLDDPEREVVIVCNEGYSSSLAAWSLQQLGLHRATDLAGGFQALLAEG